MAVANACSSYRFTLPSDSDDTADEQEWLGLERSAGRHITLADQLPGYRDESADAAPADLRGPAGLSLAAQLGCSSPPDVTQANSSHSPVREPWLLSRDRESLLRSKYLETITEVGAAPLTAFELGNTGLSWVSAGYLHPRTLHVVAGETPTTSHWPLRLTACMVAPFGCTRTGIRMRSRASTLWTYSVSSPHRVTRNES